MEILSIHVYMGPESDHYLPLSPSAVFNIVIKLPQIPPKNCINLYFHTLPQIIISINCQCHLFFFVFLSSTTFQRASTITWSEEAAKWIASPPQVHFSRECASLTSNYTENTHKDKLGNHSRANQLFFITSFLLLLKIFRESVMSKSPCQIKTIF